jgi:hypothetical protein
MESNVDTFFLRFTVTLSASALDAIVGPILGLVEAAFPASKQVAPVRFDSAAVPNPFQGFNPVRMKPTLSFDLLFPPTSKYLSD